MSNSIVFAFECDYCEKTFPYRLTVVEHHESLIVDMLTGTGETKTYERVARKWACDKCVAKLSGRARDGS